MSTLSYLGLYVVVVFCVGLGLSLGLAAVHMTRGSSS
jgi:hypothetical protein